VHILLCWVMLMTVLSLGSPSAFVRAVKSYLVFCLRFHFSYWVYVKFEISRWSFR
jgi:hypothetical protein